MKKLLVLAITLCAGFCFCEKEPQVFDLQKTNAHQRLSDVLQNINDQIETIKIDTLQLDGGELAQQLAQSEQELIDLREQVIERMRQIDSIKRENWDDFEQTLDSTEVQVTTVMQKVRETISTLTQRTPPVPPKY